MGMTDSAYERRYANDMKEMALDDAAYELAHRLFAHECNVACGPGERHGHSERCKMAGREIRKLARIWAGYEIV